MEKFTMGSGKVDLNMEVGFGKVLKVILILENGKWERQMDLESIYGSMVYCQYFELHNIYFELEILI